MQKEAVVAGKAAGAAVIQDNPENIDLESYTRYFNEIKAALMAYFGENQMPKVTEAAMQLKVLNFERIIYGRFTFKGPGKVRVGPHWEDRSD